MFLFPTRNAGIPRIALVLTGIFLLGLGEFLSAPKSVFGCSKLSMWVKNSFFSTLLITLLNLVTDTIGLFPSLIS